MKDDEDFVEEDESYEKEEGDNIYDEDDREEMVDEDELDSYEDGFMQGYNQGERATKCALCKAVLGMVFVEEKINGKTCRFCSEEHAEIYKEKLAENLEEEE
ncbi:MAG: hypothetical protein PHG05_04600 [Candidatus Nanoarchaeia archaeon]|nr:hypothetical protein [Candidatus Nanoarchaeia archaeon]